MKARQTWEGAQEVGNAYLKRYGKNIQKTKLLQLAHGAGKMGSKNLQDFFLDRANAATKSLKDLYAERFGYVG